MVFRGLFRLVAHGHRARRRQPDLMVKAKFFCILLLIGK